MNKNSRSTISDFFKIVSDKNTIFNIKKLGYLPRWVILLLDMAVVLFSGLVTYFLFQGLKLDYIPQYYLLFGFFVYLSFNLFFFLLFRTYAGIIRHSSYVDSLKLFIALVATFAVIIFLNFLLLAFNKPKLFLTTGIFINTVLSFCFLFFYRIVVKQIFERFLKEKSETTKMSALIYGSDSNAIAVANALRSENPGRFALKGFIDKNNKNTSKRLFDLPILPVKKSVSLLMRLKKIEAIIIADKTLSKDERLAIVEECIEYNFKVFTIPLVTDWEDQKEISKNIKSFEIQDLLERKPIELDMQAISDRTQNKTILITGAAGSIGSEIVRQVLNFNPKQVLLLDQAETPLHSLSLEVMALNKNIEIHNIIADVRNFEVLDKIFNSFKPNVVYHAAAYKHVPMMEENPSQAIFTNVLGTKNLADLSHKYKVERFVMISTDKAVNPSSVMGASKRIAEMYVQSKQFKHQKLKTENQTKYITTRFGNVLGSNGSVVPLFTKQIQEGGPITITHPEIIRYFMTIPEACQLVLEAGAMGKGGEIYIFDMGKPVKIIDLARKMIRLAGFKPDEEIEIKIVGLRPGEKLYEELLNDSAKNLATHHEKIMIAEEVCEEFEIVSEALDDLIRTSHNATGEMIVIKMKSIVPEFKSLNSVFESLDIKLKDSYVYTK